MKYNLLTVDDEVINNLIFKRIAERNEDVDQVIEFTSAAEMIDYTKNQDQLNLSMPDFIFIDINMPIMSGWQLIDKLSQDYHHKLKNSKIYILSSSTNSVDLRMAENNPFVDGYIIKPFSVDKLKELINEEIKLDKVCKN
jgi:CheY-like chemotaxis protein